MSLLKASCCGPCGASRPRLDELVERSRAGRPTSCLDHARPRTRRPSTAAQTSASFSAGGSRSMRVTSSASTVAGTWSGASRIDPAQEARVLGRRRSATRMPRSTSASIISLMKNGLPPVRATMWRASSPRRLVRARSRRSDQLAARRLVQLLEPDDLGARRAGQLEHAASGRRGEEARSGREAATASSARNSSRLWSSAQWASSPTMTSGLSAAKWRSIRHQDLLDPLAPLVGVHVRRRPRAGAPSSGAAARTAARTSGSSAGSK